MVPNGVHKPVSGATVYSNRTLMITMKHLAYCGRMSEYSHAVIYLMLQVIVTMICHLRSHAVPHFVTGQEFSLLLCRYHQIGN